MTKSDLIVELGFEEIPAWMLQGAAEQFAGLLSKGLEDSRLQGSPGVVWYTPRRIIAEVREIPLRQDDLVENVVGPPTSVAYDASGAPTRAALAFAQKNGVALDQLRAVRTPKGEYLSVIRRTRGEPTRALLERLIPTAVAGIQFPKAMTWSPDRFRFARPLRWIVALYGGKVVKFRVADVNSSRFTTGHRFLSRRKRIAVSSVEGLCRDLRENGVLADPTERRSRIQQGLAREAAACGGHPLEDPRLLETVVNLNELPAVIHGSFESRFLALPQEILVTVLREHQKYFSVLGSEGQILPAFLSVINLEAESTAKISAGHERVLRARLADAAFFWDTDRKTELYSRTESLREVLFQEKLGSYYDKTLRVLALLPRLAEMAGCSDQLPDLESAARMFKCDLLTEMVKEFTDLQGVVGGLYAKAEGYPETVWRAIYEQYLPSSTDSVSPSTRSGALLALADRLDTVCGSFTVGLIPSGSRDPFAVRRQGNGIVKILLDHEISGSLERMIRWSLESFSSVSEETVIELKKFFEGRLRFILDEAGIAYDCINAGLAAGFDDILDARDRVAALQQVRGETDFLSVASNFKRIANILGQAGEVAEAVDPAKFTEPAESELWQTYLEVQPCVQQARKDRDYAAALRTLASIRHVVDSFFDKVLVMADDLEIRSNRLALLAALSRLFFGVADISEIVLSRSDRSASV